MIPSITSRFVSRVSSGSWGSLGGSAGGNGTAFCLLLPFMRLELDGSGEVDSGLKLEKEVEVNEAGGLRYGKGGTSEEKLPSPES